MAFLENFNEITFDILVYLVALSVLLRRSTTQTQLNHLLEMRIQILKQFVIFIILILGKLGGLCRLVALANPIDKRFNKCQRLVKFI